MNLYREEPWVAAAECLSIGTSVFFPSKGEDWNAAKVVCATVCRVRLQCLDYAMRMEMGQDHHFRAGIFGGLGPLARTRYEPQWLAEQIEGAA
jgi:WhiB family redox-sensing transcriptional regulator